MSGLRNVPLQTLRDRLDEYKHLARHAMKAADRIDANHQIEAIRKELALRDGERLARLRRSAQG